MSTKERVQQAIITAHVQATMAYMHEMLNYAVPTLAQAAAHVAAAMVPCITQRRAAAIAATIDRRYLAWYTHMYPH